MSRWTESFKSHPFQAEWDTLKSELESANVDDPTVVTSVQELARLKRVVAFIDSIIFSIEPELAPKAIWDTFHQQTTPCLAQIKAYASDRNISHIVDANTHADNLLSYVKPYLVAPTEAIEAMKTSSIVYVAVLENAINSFKDSTESAAAAIEESAQKSAKYLADIEQEKDKAESYLFELTEGDGETPSIKSLVSDLVRQVEEKNKSIAAYHQQLIDGTDEADSIQFQIEEAHTSISESNTKILSLLKTVSTKTTDLENFHTVVFGVTEEDGTVRPGLKQEIETRSSDIDKLTTTQTQRYDALFKKIEDLLPGATSAGLASSYEKLKSSFNLPIILSTALFIAAIGLLVIGAMYMVTKELAFTPEFKLVLEEIPEWSVIFKALLFKAAFVAPVVWLAVFASTRRNQYARLKQEYAHKEALATSYESYKKQIADLGEASNDLQQRLIQSAIDAIAFNASTTLDKKHVEKLPLQELMDKLSFAEAKRLLEIIKQNENSSKGAKLL